MVNLNHIKDAIDKVCEDTEFNLEMASEFQRRCDKYVPFLEGILSQSAAAQVEPGQVRYGGADIGVPYARYQYYGTNFNHTLEYHPLATAKWDEAMIANESEAFIQDINELFLRRLKDEL